jgi:hypothetical protein
MGLSAKLSEGRANLRNADFAGVVTIRSGFGLD